MKWLMRLFRRNAPALPIILRGGKKPIEVKSIRRKISRLGGGAEGKVYEIKVVVKRGRKRKVLRLVEKEFYQKQESLLEALYPSIRNPIKQLETMQGLLKLN